MNFKPLLFILTALSLFAASASYAENAEMAVLQGQYEKTLNEHHKSVYEPAFQQLTANYFTGLERSIAEAKKAGDLPTILALEAESQRILKKEPLPTNDEQVVKPLQKLRVIYRAELAKLEAQRESKKESLLPSHLALLKKLEIELTQAGRLDAAKEVMDYRESLAAAPPTKASPSSGGSEKNGGNAKGSEASAKGTPDDFIKSGAVGGDWGKPFMEAPGDVRLIGFVVHYGIDTPKNKEKIVQSVAPIWLKNREEIVGAAYGAKEGPETIFKAKPGYAVGGMEGRGGTKVDSLRLTFMRIKGLGLDPADSYKSERFGGSKGDEGKVMPGHGASVIGIYGGSGHDLNSIGLLYAKSGTKRP